MANRYGEAALMAVRQEAAVGVSPAERWERALSVLYPTSVTARKKATARGAFLGLCEEGLVKSMPAGAYRASRQDKAYAVQAVALLAEGALGTSRSALWKAVTNNSGEKENSQMDVVLALWKNNLIIAKSPA